MMPTIRPNVAPMVIEGTKMPAGTLHPYDTTTKPRRITVAKKRELTICHWYAVLHRIGSGYFEAMTVRRYLLAKMIEIAGTITLPKEDFHALCHVNTEEVVEPSNHRGDSGEYDGLRDSMFSEVTLPERCDLEVELDDKRTIQTLQFNDSQTGSVRGIYEHTPNIPRMMKNMISKKCQSRS